MTHAPEPVLLLLKEVRVYGSYAHPQRLGVAFELRVVINFVPGDMDGHGGAYAGVTVYLGRVRYLLEGIAGHARLRKDGEARAGIAVAPGRGLYPLRPQTLFDSLQIHPSGRERFGQSVIRPYGRAL